MNNDEITYLGIDNGVSGALAFYKPATLTLISVPMPTVKAKKGKGFKTEYDLPQILAIIRQFPHIRFAVLEKAQAYPRQGSVSNFSIGKGYGLMEGMLASLGIPYQVVHPKTWQKKMFEGMPHDDTKQASILTAQRLFPGVSFKASDKSTILHNGMTDAALMAHFGYTLNK